LNAFIPAEVLLTALRGALKDNAKRAAH